MPKPDFDLDKASVFALVTKAKELADLLDFAGMSANGELIRELCRRVVPIKLVPTTGIPVVAVSDPVPSVPTKAWCQQCEAMVSRPCGAKICGRVA